MAMVEFVFFRGFFLVMAKLSFGGEDYAPGNNSTNFIKPKVLSLSLTRQGTQFITNNHASFYLCERKNCSAIKKFQNVMNIIVAKPDSVLYMALAISDQSNSQISAYE